MKSIKNKVKQKTVKQKLNEGGLFVGPSHAEGGIKFRIEKTGALVEVEGEGKGEKNEHKLGEFLVCNNAMASKEEKVYRGKPAEILSEMNQEHGCNGLNEKAEKIKGGESVINRRSTSMESEFECEGTPEGIASAINKLDGRGVDFSSEGKCRLVKKALKDEKLVKDGVIRAEDGKMEYGGITDLENLPQIRLDDKFYEQKAWDVISRTFPEDKNRIKYISTRSIDEHGVDQIVCLFTITDDKPLIIQGRRFNNAPPHKIQVAFYFTQPNSATKASTINVYVNAVFINTYDFKDFNFKDGGKLNKFNAVFKPVDCKHQIFAVISDNTNNLSRIFVRIGEYYDGSKFKDKIFTLDEFKEYWKESHGGKFTYYDWWFGFNVPDYSIKSFVTGKFDPLLPEEKWLIDNIKSKVDTSKPYYIVGYAKGNDAVRRHELAHALYYLSPKYKKAVNAVIDSIPKSELTTLTKFLDARKYHKSVYKDEMQAYLLADKKFLQEQNGWKDSYEKYRKKLNDIFDESDIPDGKQLDKMENGGNIDDFASSEKNTNFNKNIKDEITKIISGTRPVTSGATIQAALIHIRRNAGANPSSSKTKSELEAEILTEFIDKNNLWYTEKLDEDNYIGRGVEQLVYKDQQHPNFVVKTNNFIFYNSWDEYLINLLLHNYFFPRTAYELIGFKRNDRGKFFPVVRQPFAEMNSPTDLKEVEKFLLDQGFIRTHPLFNVYENKDMGIIIGDLHEGNVLTKDNALYFIDTKFFISIGNDLILKNGGNLDNFKLNSNGEYVKTKYLAGGITPLEETIDDTEYRFIKEIGGIKEGHAYFLEEIIRHDKLFEQYPEFKKIIVTFNDIINDELSSDSFISLEPNKLPEIQIGLHFTYYKKYKHEKFELRRTDRPEFSKEAAILHEINHAIQYKNRGFAGLGYNEITRAALRENNCHSEADARRRGIWERIEKEIEYFYFKQPSEQESLWAVDIWLKKIGLAYGDRKFLFYDEPSIFKKIQQNRLYSAGGTVNSSIELNSNGGYDYKDKKDKKIADRCGLVTLPKNIKGTNCGNCIFQKNNFCDHKSLLLPVTSRMCCSYWDSKSISSIITNLPKADFFPDKTKSTAKLNDHGGYDYSGKELERAKKADLITLPVDIEGTNCAKNNCVFGGNICKHPKIKLPVTERQSCGWWNNEDVIRPWGKPVENKFLKGGPIKNAINNDENSSTVTSNSQNEIKIKTRKKEYILPVGDITAEKAIKKVKYEYPTFKEFEYKGIVYKKTGMKGEFLKRIEPIETIEARWKKKKERIHTMANDIQKLRNNVSRDLKSENEKTALTALIIAIQDRTAERVGNIDSENEGHYGVTGFKKSHATIIGNKVLFCYTGKSGVDHEKEINDQRICKALKKAIKNSPSKFIFTTSDGLRIRANHVNDYLREFGVNSKDIRGYSANKWMMDGLKKIEVIEDTDKKRKKQFNKVLKYVAGKVGHGSGTLRTHYLMPELIDEFINNGKILDIKEYRYQDGGAISREAELKILYNNIKKQSDDPNNTKDLKEFYSYADTKHISHVLVNRIARFIAEGKSFESFMDDLKNKSLFEDLPELEIEDKQTKIEWADWEPRKIQQRGRISRKSKGTKQIFKTLKEAHNYIDQAWDGYDPVPNIQNEPSGGFSVTILKDGGAIEKYRLKTWTNPDGDIKHYVEDKEREWVVYGPYDTEKEAQDKVDEENIKYNRESIWENMPEIDLTRRYSYYSTATRPHKFYVYDESDGRLVHDSEMPGGIKNKFEKEQDARNVRDEMNKKMKNGGIPDFDKMPEIDLGTDIELLEYSKSLLDFIVTTYDKELQPTARKSLKETVEYLDDVIKHPEDKNIKDHIKHQRIIFNNLLSYNFSSEYNGQLKRHIKNIDRYLKGDYSLPKLYNNGGNTNEPIAIAAGILSGGKVTQVENSGYEFISGELLEGSDEYWNLVGAVGGEKAKQLLGRGVTIRKKPVEKKHSGMISEMDIKK